MSGRAKLCGSVNSVTLRMTPPLSAKRTAGIYFGRNTRPRRTKLALFFFFFVCWPGIYFGVSDFHIHCWPMFFCFV